MTDASVDEPASRPVRAIGSSFGAWAVAESAVLTGQLLAVYFLYHPETFVFECRAYASPLFCGFLSAGVMRAGAVAIALVMCLLAWPASLRALRREARPDLRWAAVQAVGFALILWPAAVLTEGTSPALFSLAAASWTLGALAFAAGSAFFLAPPASWIAAARAVGAPLAAVLLAALALPDVAPIIRDQTQFLWHLQPVTYATFRSTEWLLGAFGQEVYSDPLVGPHLGIGEFIVGVGRQCSGVEGFALITGFTLLYLGLFRDRLRFPRVWLLLPIGIALSWCLNVVRIAVLIWIGAYVSPELAVDGFHSHAGWLMFTLLWVTMAATAHRIAWFRSDVVGGAATADVVAPRRPRPAFLDDPATAQILPFIVFMASALLASTVSQTPALLYPLRAIAMAAALTLVWPVVRRLAAIRIDPLAIGAGAAVGALWLVTAPPAGEGDAALAAALEMMPAWMLLIWAMSRVVGTSILVPIIEELFFRGYLLRRLDIGGTAMRLAALAVSSLLFAALHDRWMAAALAGLVFGLLALRQGRVGDAIVAHAAANAMIAAAAVSEGDWSVI